MKKAYYTPYLLCSYLSLLSLAVLDNVRAPFFADVIKEMQISDVEASLFYGVTSFVAFISSYFAHSLLKYISSLAGLKIGLLFLALGFFAMSQATTYPWLLVFCAVFGIGFGLQGVLQHTVIEEGAETRLRRRLFSGLHSVYAGASLAAPLLIAYLLGIGWGWRESFLLASVCPFAVLLISFFIGKIKVPYNKAEQQEEEIQVAKPVKTWKVAYASLIMAFYIPGELSLSTRLVLYLRRDFSMAADTATYYLAGFFALLLLGRLVFTFFNLDRFKSSLILKVSLVTSIACYMAGIHIDPWFLVLSGIFMSPYFAVGMDHLSELFVAQSAQAMSLAMAIGALGVVSMHAIIGYLTDTMGLAAALNTGPALLLGALVVVLTLPKLTKA